MSPSPPSARPPPTRARRPCCPPWEQRPSWPRACSPGGGDPGGRWESPPLRAVGRISYSWYLWHYPVLTLAPYALGRTPGPAGDLLLAAGSGILAAATFHLVEQPARRARWLTGHPWRSLAAGTSVSGLAAAVCVGLLAALPASAGNGHAAPAASVRSGTAATLVADPAQQQLAADVDQVAAAVASSASVTEVPSNLDPSLRHAAASVPAPMVDGCLPGYTVSSYPTCLFGDRTATRAVVLFGDSHAAMWFPAVDAWARSAGYRLYVRTKAACPPVDITSPAGARVSGGGIVGIDGGGKAAERGAVITAGATYADVTPWLCTYSVCDAVVDNLLVYRDDSHITAAYATYLAPLVADEIGVAFGR